MAGNTVIKEVAKAGTLISKDKLIDLIKKSNQTTFTFSQNPTSKQAVVVVNV